MDPSEESTPPDRPTFRKNLLRVMAVQIVALALLWFLQATYGR
jgi:hypothetical protein